MKSHANSIWYPLVLFLVAISCGPEHPRFPQRIVLVPIGSVPTDVSAHVQRELSLIVKGEVTVANGIVAPMSAFNHSRRQYLGDALLRELTLHDVKEADRIIGVIDADVYAPGLNFILGQARKPGRFAVVALPRLRQSFRGETEDQQRFRERVVKVTVHELGHTVGFAHCPDTECVMHFANTVSDVDSTGREYCRREHLRD